MNIFFLITALSCITLITNAELIPAAPSEAEFEAHIERILASYPATYTAASNVFKISTVTATNPDRNESITGIKKVILHRNFNPEKSFESAGRFDNTRAVLFTRDNKQHAGYIESASNIGNDTWAISITELTTAHATAPSFPQDIRPQMPASKNQVTIAVTPKSKDAIRKELRAQLSR